MYFLHIFRIDYMICTNIQESLSKSRHMQALFIYFQVCPFNPHRHGNALKLVLFREGTRAQNPFLCSYFVLYQRTKHPVSRADGVGKADTQSLALRMVLIFHIQPGGHHSLFCRGKWAPPSPPPREPQLAEDRLPSPQAQPVSLTHLYLSPRW